MGTTEPGQVFVYGSLLTGLEAHGLVAPFVVERRAAWAQGALWSLGTYPALTRGKGAVLGELLTLREAERALAVLDAYEGVGPEGDGLYARVVAPVALADGRRLRTVLYLAERTPAGTRVWAGDWRLHRRGRARLWTPGPRPSLLGQGQAAVRLPDGIHGWAWEVPVEDVPVAARRRRSVAIALAGRLATALPVHAGELAGGVSLGHGAEAPG
jgi:gamma-glutamylcyclotransferase (GGCT)/AIG2-like uncharacterized protein YtfP